MVDGTRPLDGAAEAFTVFVVDWLEEFGCLLEALALLRRAGTESLACQALLDVAEVVAFREAWELWSLWSGSDPRSLIGRTAPYLGAFERDLISVALWGATEPGD